MTVSVSQRQDEEAGSCAADRRQGEGAEGQCQRNVCVRGGAMVHFIGSQSKQCSDSVQRFINPISAGLDRKAADTRRPMRGALLCGLCLPASFSGIRNSVSHCSCDSDSPQRLPY